jgi:hypothetical protein
MWAYSANKATDLENISVLPEHKATSYEFFYDGNPEWIGRVHKFGEIAIVRDTVKIWSKLKNQGFPAIYLGPVTKHAKNVHTFWNPKIRMPIYTWMLLIADLDGSNNKDTYNE